MSPTPGRSIGINLILLICGIGAGAYGIYGYLNNVPETWQFGIAGLMCSFFGLISGHKALRSKLAEQKLGKIHLEVKPKETRGGEMIQCALHFKPTSELHINTVTVLLKGIERFVSGSGTWRKTHRHEFHQSKDVLLSERHIQQNEPVALYGKIPIPHDAAPTFTASYNQIFWIVEVQMDIARWPDWSHEEHLWMG